MSRCAHKDTPDVDHDEESKVHDTMDWEDEDEQMIGHRLQVTIQRVEGVRCKRRRNYEDDNSERNSKGWRYQGVPIHL